MYFKTSYGNIGISDSMKAKMQGMLSLSTSPLTNAGCIRNCKVAGSICQSCYSITSNKMYVNLRNMIQGNKDILTKYIIPTHELPFINHTIFRFESHGDINNSVQLQNYVNIANNNRHVVFALWTKQYAIAEKFFDKVDKPRNFVLIYSSIMTNHELKLKNFRHVDKIFTVYDKETIESKKITINCGAKSCLSCRSCYRKGGVKYIREKKKWKRSGSLIKTVSDIGYGYIISRE